MDFKFVRWMFEVANKQGGLATLLVLLLFAMAIGWLPSPMLAAAQQITKEHNETATILKKICRNTAKNQNQLDACDN